MTDSDYVWRQIASNRWRHYKKSDLESRPVRYGDAPAVHGDEIRPAHGPDGRVYESRAEFSAACKRENCYEFNGKEYREHMASKKRDRAASEAQIDGKMKEKIVEITNDYSLSNKI